MCPCCLLARSKQELTGGFGSDFGDGCGCLVGGLNDGCDWLLLQILVVFGKVGSEKGGGACRNDQHWVILG